MIVNMEKHHQNFSQKTEASDEQIEKKEGKRTKTIEIKIREQLCSLEVESYDFEYPEAIQKETGILGYERTKISNKDFFEICKFDMKPLIEKYNIQTADNFFEKYDSLKLHKYGDVEYQDCIVFDKNINKAVERLLKELSAGEYPDYCYNHTMGAYAGGYEKEMKEDFKNDRMFLQKIYDTDRIEKNISHGHNTKAIFNHPVVGAFGTRNAWSNVTLYEKKTHQKIKENEYIGDITKYKKEFKEGSIIAASSNAGLNVLPSNFWTSGSRDGGTDMEALSFGFPISGDSFLREYRAVSLELLLDLEKDNLKKMCEDPDRYNMRGVGAALIMYALNEFSIKETVPQNINLRSEEGKVFTEKINTIINLFFENKNLPNPFKGNNLIAEAYLPYLGIHGLPDETFLPIVIGDEKVPQLAWGHAKYAHYTNEKGFNFFKFKHADHLPVKE